MLAGTALAAGHATVEPGGKIGVMTIARGDRYSSNWNLWLYCPTNINKVGTYHKSCNIPKGRLYIGAEDWSPSQRKLDTIWKQERWRLWIDGQPVDLPRFGASDNRGSTICAGASPRHAGRAGNSSMSAPRECSSLSRRRSPATGWTSTTSGVSRRD